MGLLAGWLALKAGEGWTQSVRLFFATGILGGFTTFSAFSLDAVLLWERGASAAAAAYVLASVVLSIAGLLAGLFVVRVLT
jgi:CrcB protein